MNFKDLPEGVRLQATVTLRELITQGCDLSKGVEMAGQVKAAFAALYAEENLSGVAGVDSDLSRQPVGVDGKATTTNETIVSNVIIQIEPRVLGLEKLEALVELLSEPLGGLVEGAGSATGFRFS